MNRLVPQPKRRLPKDGTFETVQSTDFTSLLSVFRYPSGPLQRYCQGLCVTKRVSVTSLASVLKEEEEEEEEEERELSLIHI